MSESVKETVDRVMQQAGYYDHPYQVGERTFYVNGDSPFAQVKNDLNGLPQRINEWTQNYINNQQPLRVDTPQNNLQQYANQAGLGMENKVSNRLIDGSSILLGRGIK